ncbi:Hypothetical predicted protein [Paramuricea clavata]|uniref:Uncharacterized protein n=1 Tax=Paramuricea clavata TaxID=317549 RepID=A0A7D9IUM9_PARCT|nr:Hypothetical predicted protein [Paramuricea clavata]
MENLHRVLQRLPESGLKLKREKFYFMLGEVIYLGMSISEAGISPTKEKVQAIKDAAPPANVSELQSFIGTANFLRVGAVLLQPGHDGSLQPVAFASRTLNTAEKNYAQIERESLAIVFGVTKFRQYLLGRHFKLLTDHKPLITLLGEHKSVPQLASAQIKRWSLLAAYNYMIEFISGKENVYADFLSRKPINIQPTPEEQNGWPEKPQPELQSYHTRRLELSHDDGILLWDTRVVIPESLRDILLKDLHAEHFGIVKMKQLARKYLWWPKLDEEIEERVIKASTACQEEAKSPNASQQAS